MASDGCGPAGARASSPSSKVAEYRWWLHLGLRTGRDRLYTTADGLGPGRQMCAYADLRGDLWFGRLLRLSRLTPALGAAVFGARLHHFYSGLRAECLARRA